LEMLLEDDRLSVSTLHARVAFCCV
jgi:hypothetical protein